MRMIENPNHFVEEPIMKIIAVRKRILLLALSLLLVGGQWVFAETDDKTLAPYFFVQSEDASVDRLPLKSTSVEADIAGVIADVRVTQVYQNEGQNPLEAIYIFPASTRAAVYGMKMTIGERTIVAKIDKREAARKTYEAAREAGKSASLLEQQRPNVFQMNVANIMPGDKIRVELSYTELLIPTDAQYEFMFPTVVGPRYVEGDPENPPEDWVANPYLHEGEPPTSTVDITVSLAAGLPLQQIACSSHPVDTTYTGTDQARVTLSPSEKAGGNRDFILKYRLAGGKIDSGLILSKGEEENFFLLMVQPPERVADIKLPPREYVFIVDVSGSMNGFPLSVSKKLLRNLIGNLRPSDQFNVLLFAGGTSVLSETPLPANRENINRAVHLIDNQHGGGGTRLLPALERCISLPKSAGMSRNVVIVTDGYVSVEKEAFDLIATSLGKANVFTFGIGSSVNRYLIEGMARVGAGEPFVVTRPESADATAEKFRRLIEYPALTGITVNWNDLDVYDVSPAGIPDLLAERPVVVFGKWRGAAAGSISLRGQSGDSVYEKTLSADTATVLKKSGLAQLWARHRIAILSDYNRLSPTDERIAAVTNLGLDYNLLTQYTSFVAVDSLVRNKDGESTTVKQPLPLPQGVSDYAVGQKMRMARHIYAQPLAPNGFGGSRKMALDETLGPAESAAPPIPTGPTVEVKEVDRFQVISSTGLTNRAAAKTIRAHMEHIRRCIHAEKRKKGVLPVSMTATLVIDTDGKVKTVTIQEKIKEGQTIVNCVVETLKKIRFNLSSGAGKGEVIVSFMLAS